MRDVDTLTHALAAVAIRQTSISFDFEGSFMPSCFQFFSSLLHCRISLYLLTSSQDIVLTSFFFIASLQKCQRTKFSFNSKRSRSRSDPSKGTRYKHANIPRSVRNFKLDHLLFKAVKFQDDSLTQDFLISDS